MPEGVWRFFPHINATLNACSLVLIIAGLVAVKRGKIAGHQRFMLGAATTSALFLVCYLAYHFAVGSVRFNREGTIRTVYLAILLSHTILAVVQVPLILITIRHGLKGRIAQHKRIAKITAPIWLYVSLTGVVVYWMLYQL